MSRRNDHLAPLAYAPHPLLSCGWFCRHIPFRLSDCQNCVKGDELQNMSSAGSSLFPIPTASRPYDNGGLKQLLRVVQITSKIILASDIRLIEHLKETPSNGWGTALSRPGFSMGGDPVAERPRWAANI